MQDWQNRRRGQSKIQKFEMHVTKVGERTSLKSCFDFFVIHFLILKSRFFCLFSPSLIDEQEREFSILQNVSVHLFNLVTDLLHFPRCNKALFKHTYVSV